VHIGPVLRGYGENGGGRELEFIVRSLLELKLQVEELRHRIDDDRVSRVAPGIAGGAWLGEVQPSSPIVTHVPPVAAVGSGASVAAIEPRDQAPPANMVTITPGTKMADIERAAIEAALRETRGNRRRAAEMLGIGERTLYRKIKEYRLPEHVFADD
jgi:DNA-binding NtrC family response regulator